MNSFKKIGILGGTFNPVHYGHLFIAGCALREFALDKVLFVPAARPPHKKEKEVLSGEHRVNMLKLALEGQSNYLLSTLEIDREGYSYTIDTLRQLSKQYPQTEFYFILGLDAFMDLPAWKEPDELKQLCSFIVVNRPHDKRPNADYSADEAVILDKKVHFLSIPGISISSSMIRSRVVNGKNVRYLLPDKVIAYIKAHQLYES